MEIDKKIAMIILLMCFLIALFSIYMLLDIVASKNYICTTESTTALAPYTNFPQTDFTIYSQRYATKGSVEPISCFSISQPLKHKIKALFWSLITWVVSVLAAHLLNYFTDWGINKIKAKR